MIHGVRHWQPLMDTGHEGQSAGTAVGVELGVGDFEGEKEVGAAVVVGALERVPLEEKVCGAEAAAEALGRAS